jgi:hypothetical protein
MYGSFFMFVSIIPSLHSLGVEPLLYSFDAPLKNQLQVGQLVEIPFGKIQKMELLLISMKPHRLIL